MLYKINDVLIGTKTGKSMMIIDMEEAYGKYHLINLETDPVDFKTYILHEEKINQLIAEGRCRISTQ